MSAAAYHAGMDAETRQAVLQSWRSGAVMVVCATSALGMRLIALMCAGSLTLGLPDSLLRYVQEIGRAGRDGKAAEAIADPRSRKPVRFTKRSSPEAARLPPTSGPVAGGAPWRLLDADEDCGDNGHSGRGSATDPRGVRSQRMVDPRAGGFSGELLLVGWI